MQISQKKSSLRLQTFGNEDLDLKRGASFSKAHCTRRVNGSYFDLLDVECTILSLLVEGKESLHR